MSAVSNAVASGSTSPFWLPPFTAALAMTGASGWARCGGGGPVRGVGAPRLGGGAAGPAIPGHGFQAVDIASDEDEAHVGTRVMACERSADTARRASDQNA